MTKKKKIKVKEFVESSKAIMLDTQASPDQLRSAMGELITIVSVFLGEVKLNSKNRNVPPSQDPNRKKKLAKGKKRKPGAQPGHKGGHLKKWDEPTKFEEYFIDRRTLPTGNYEHVGFETRQVFELDVNITVIEHRAEILRDEYGNEFVAEFSDGVTEPTQYGNSVKATSVYMSQSQLIPQDRVREPFHDQFGLPISKGSIGNFNVLAYKKLEQFEQWARGALMTSPVNHSDETGINVAGTRIWLHSLSNEKATLFHPNEKRGKEAMDRMGILQHFKGILVHDHWKPYFGYDCTHSLCNAHHLRELEYAHVECDQRWAKSMQNLLFAMRAAVEKSGGILPKKKSDKYRRKYRRILKRAKAECPKNEKTRAQSKSRNLLERLESFETETLRFMDLPIHLTGPNC